MSDSRNTSLLIEHAATVEDADGGGPRRRRIDGAAAGCRFRMTRGSPPARLVASILIAVAFMLSRGCTESTDGVAATASAESVSRSASDGPVSVTVTMSPKTVEVGAQATITIEITAPRGLSVETEDFRRILLEGDRRFELGVTGTHKKEAAPAENDRLLWRYDYEVTFFLPGTFEIPPVVVHYTDARDELASASNPSTGGADTDPQRNKGEANAQPREIRTEPMSITAFDPEAAALTESDLYDIKVVDPPELRRPFTHWLWIIPLTVALLTAGWLLRRQRRRRTADQAAVPIPAHEWAWRELAKLLADDLLKKGRVQEFYYRVSDIVRGYIERRFGVSAPEMTTEEFLHASAQDPRFSVEHRNHVAQFLQACDLVKYARHIPQLSEADELLAAARTFIEQTRERSAMEQRLAPVGSRQQEQAA